jgi:ABC-type transporter Mla subunit MlaD
MNKDQLEGKWKQLKGRAKEKSGKVTLTGVALLVFAGACGDQSRDTEPVQDEATVSADEFRAAMNEMRTELRSTLDQFGSQISELDERFMSANDVIAQEWAETREELSSYRQTLEADLARLENASEEEVDQLTEGIASDLEELTHRVERAQLESVETAEEFVSAAQDRLTSLDQDFRMLEQEAQGLPMEARDEVSETMQELSETAWEIRTQLEGLAQASAEQVSEVREEIAEDVSSLTASVKRELFEARQGWTTTTSMNN